MIIDDILEEHMEHIAVAKEHISACIKYNISPNQVMKQIQDIYNIELPEVYSWNEVFGFLCSANIKLQKLNEHIKTKEKEEKEFIKVQGQIRKEKKIVKRNKVKPKNYQPYEPKYDGINAL